MSLGLASGTNASFSFACAEVAGPVCDKPDGRKTDGLDCQHAKTASPTEATLKPEKYI